MVDTTKNILVTVKDSGVTDATKRIKDLGQAALLSGKRVDALAASVARMNAAFSGLRTAGATAGFRSFSASVNQASPSVNHLTAALRQLNSTLQNNAARTFAASMGTAGTAISSVSAKAASANLTMGALGGVFRLMAGYLGIRQIAQYADAWASLSGQISVVTDNENQLIAVRDRLFQVSQNVRQSVTEVTGLYGRMAIGAKDLGMSQNDLIQITENVSKTLSYSHVSAERASGALMQLSRSFATPHVMARDFNSVLHQIPALVQQIANHVDGAGGSINKLRQMMLNKTLTNADWAKGILGATDDINKMFGKAAPLISQGLAVISNDFKKLFGNMNETVNVGGRLVELGQWAGEHLPEISAGLLGIGAAAAVAFAPRTIVAFTTALRVMSSAAMANPFIAMASAITGVTVAVYAMRDSIKVGQDGVVSLGDVFSSMSEASGGFVKNVTNSVNSGLGFLSTLFGDTQKDYDKTLKHSGDVTAEFYDGVGNGMSDFFIAMAKGFDHLTTLISVLSVQIVSTGALITKTIGDAWNFLDRHKIIAGIAEAGAGAAAVYGSGGTAAGVGGGALITRGVMNIGDGIKDTISGTTPKENQSKSYAEIFKESNDQIQSILKNQHSAEEMTISALKNVRHNSLVRKTNEIEGELDGTSGMNTHGTPTLVDAGGKNGKASKIRDYTEAVANAFDSMMKKLYPSLDLIVERSKDINVINAALKKKFITPEIAKVLEQRVQSKWEYTDNPENLRQANTFKERQEVDSWSRSANTRRSYVQAQEEYTRLWKEGADREKLDINALTQHYYALNKDRDIMAEFDSLTTKFIDSAYRRDVKAAGISHAADNGIISNQTEKSMQVQNAVDYRNSQLEAGYGNSNDLIQSAVGKAREGFTNVRAGASSAMGDFFTSFTDGFSNSIGAAISGMQSFGQAVKSVAQGAVGSLISSLVKLGIQWAITSAMSSAMAASSTAATAPIIAQGQMIADAYSQAALNVSLATFGANATGATAGIALAESVLNANKALGSVGKGFKSGGYTGDMGVSDVAGVVHGKEYVMNAEATARIGRDTLDAMSAGTIPTSSGGSGGSKRSTPSAVHVSIPQINVNNPQIPNGNFDTKTQEKLANAINEQVTVAVHKTIVNAQRAGGQLSGVKR